MKRWYMAVAGLVLGATSRTGWAQDEESAPEVALVVSEGAPPPGGEVPLLVVVHRGGAVAVPGLEPHLAPSAGAVLRRDGEISPGVWRFHYRAPSVARGPIELDIGVGDTTTQAFLELAEPAPPSLIVPANVIGYANSKAPLEVEVKGPDLPPPGDLQVAVPEGQVTGVRLDGDSLVVSWVPPPDPFARAVPLGVRDGRRPGQAPAWTTLRLRSRPRIPVRTEPGTKVSITVGGRSYGPFVADETGLADGRVEMHPGDEVADVVMVDRHGNSQRSQVNLGGARLPSMVAMAEGSIVSGRAPPPVHLYAVAHDGSPWRGDDPTCVTSAGELAPPVSRGKGQWWVSVPSPPSDSSLGVKLDCTLTDQSSASVRLPVEPGIPARLVLRSYPEELSADLPLAQVQAFLENQLGDRLPAAGIMLTAERGDITVDATGPGGVLAAEYQGRAAVERGRDVLRATWNLDSGSGGVWGLDVAAGEVREGRLVVHGRALDRRGRPLEGVSMSLGAGGEAAEGLTNGRGWASAEVEVAESTGSPLVIEARAGALVRRRVLLEAEAHRDPFDPDLSATLELPIRAGRVREVFLVVEPRTLSPGETARVSVRMTDREGLAVADEPIVLRVVDDVGTVTPPRVRSDGTFEALYDPPANTSYATVALRATTADGTFGATTEVELLPREVLRTPGVNVGYLVGARGFSAPWASLDFDLRIPHTDLPLYARASVGWYGERSSVDDGVGETLLAIDLVPVSAGALVRREHHRRALWLGGETVLAPYRVHATFQGAEAVSDFALAPPGFGLFTGVGRRVRNSELQLQAHYLFIAMPLSDIGWQGPVGGVVGTLGYKLIF